MSHAWTPQSVTEMVGSIMLMGAAVLWLLNVFGVSLNITISHETDNIWIHHKNEDDE